MIVAKPNIVERISSEVDDPSLTEVVVVCACDDNYAMPLTVMLHSAAKNLDSGSRLSVYFIDGGISESSWQAIKETLVDFEVSVYSLKPDYSLVEHLHTSHPHIVYKHHLPDYLDTFPSHTELMLSYLFHRVRR